MKHCFFLLIFLLAIPYCSFAEEQQASKEELPIPLGLPSLKWPQDNPYSKKKAELGRILYFDKRLSADGTISCASCHSIKRAFADKKTISVGIKGRKGTRHAPTVINAAYQPFQFWDGRAKSLEDQCKGPLGNPKEMALSSDPHEALSECVERIKKIQGYGLLFKDAFGSDEITLDKMIKSIATFERTLLSGNSPYDRYMAGDKKAMTEEQIQGLKIFNKSMCNNCHWEPLFSDGKFHNIGVGMDHENPDLGRYDITKNEKDWGAFKTPTLRETSLSYPYMHDGSIKTLEEVIDYYDKGGNPNKNLHHTMKPLHLSDADKKAMLSFLKALNGEGWQHFGPPEQFPK